MRGKTARYVLETGKSAASVAEDEKEKVDYPKKAYEEYLEYISKINY